MELKPAQIIGLVAIMALGGVLAFTFLESGSDKPGPSAATAAQEAAAAARAPVALQPPGDPTSAGSADAKDDLYCQGLIFAAHRAAVDLADPKERRRILLAPALASAGADKLIKEGVATRETTAVFADAHTDVAMADFAKGRPRIPLAACEARAEAALSALGK